MMDIGKIRRAFSEYKFRYTKHAAEQRIARRVSGEEIEESILGGEIIEQYPTDKYGPSCLICGQAKSGRVLHIQIALLPMISVVTVYEPNPKEWIDHKIRRRQR
ncbi:MAG: DUF4258 domain-containing protein [Chlamydiae bacterium]|nr:DUF4258 domain-containing protein [Chlamydiota bacterium]MBI3276583.1 DUF4258 domain-containing protein [Chlamydiota bacterium]